MLELIDPIKRVLEGLREVCLDVLSTRPWVRGDDHDIRRICLRHQLNGQP